MTAEVRTITKRDLADSVAQRTEQKKLVVRETIQCLLDCIIEELGEGNRIEMRDFGVFEVKSRAARTAQNPKTLERVSVPPRASVRFKPGRKMRDCIADAPVVHVTITTVKSQRHLADKAPSRLDDDA